MLARLLATVVALLLGASCEVSAAAEPPPPGSLPSLDQGAAAGLALAADDARRLAYLRNDPAPLSALYSPALLRAEAARLAIFAGRGTALEETVGERHVVHARVEAGRAEVVLALQGQSRRVAAGGAVRSWSAFFRQTAVEISFAEGRWLVEGVEDLAPARWWP